MLHVDLCGPMRIRSRGGKRYVLVIVDDYSRFTWTLFLASKDETFEKFLAFLKKTEKRVGHPLVCLRSDHNFSAPRTPQQNKVVEHKNQTLEDMTRTMLITSGLARSSWAEALNTLSYIINRCMIRPILNKTPSELLKGRKLNIMHLRVFGCKYFVHNNRKDALGKFNPRSDEAIILTHSSHNKAYKVFNKRTLCVEESVHVLFDETNSLVEIDAQDDDFDLGLANKNLLLTHEEGMYPEDGSGPGAVSLEDGQGLNQIGESTAEPGLDQNQPNFSRTGWKTGSGTGSETGSRTGSATVLNLFRRVFQQE